MHGYGIVSRLETNFRLSAEEIDGTWSAATFPVYYTLEDCFCPYDTLCKKPTGIYVRQHLDHVVFEQNAFNNTLLHTVPGVNVGCQMLDAVLQSNLSSQYPETLTCPCSSISIEYKQFISFQPTFHQICSSDFVTTNWIESFVSRVTLVRYDIRSIGSIYFTTLSKFCNLSLETINNALLSFNSTKYTTRNVQQLDLFQSQTEKIIDDLEKSTTNSFLQLLSIYKHTFIDNALFSGYLSSYRYTTITDNSSNSLNQVFFPAVYSPDENDSSIRCSCKTSPLTCGQSTGFYEASGNDNFLIFIVPGIRVSCFLTDSLLQSTLECFFDQQCFDRVQNFTVSTSRFPFTTTALKYNSTNTQYNTNTSIGDIVDNLMIEQWNNKTSFISYFEQCNSQSCTYSYTRNGDLRYIFTTIIGLIAGLITILRVLIPPIVSFARRKKKPLTSPINRPQHVSHTRIQQMLISLKTIILTLNLFKNINKRSDNQLYRQRIATRIYFILSSLSLTIILLFISLENSTHTIIVEHPTIDQYNALLRQYSDSLYCSCTTISVEYQDIISFQPRFHTICSSIFINPTSVWLSIDYPASMFDEYDSPTFRTKPDDFRNMASPFFQFISSSCQLSLQAISTQLLAFYSTTLITPKLISPEQFQIQINQLISGFIENTAQVFLSSLLLANNMTRANMLISGLSSDSVLTLYPDYYYRIYYDYEYVYDNTDQVYNATLSGTNCDCQYSSWCKQQAIVYYIDAITYLFVIPGIFVGCYVVEAVLQSDLQCFYNFSCLQELSDKLMINISESDVLSLNSSRYQMNTSMLEIISHLMVEEWNNRTSYSIYFNRCQPKSCTATYIGRGDIVYIVTTMITLIGGLTTLYKFLIPIIVSVFMKIIIPFITQKFNQNNVIPTIETISSPRIPI
ncbi:unnamed protein product [Adineta steineri]|uniref:Uncharacterized protein n=2 Tax=Adineta steineri TaxID=433720 RepID=A0A813YNW5_9BILA|nr:unnamed protein product [Adineta steineri]